RCAPTWSPSRPSRGLRRSRSTRWGRRGWGGGTGASTRGGRCLGRASPRNPAGPRNAGGGSGEAAYARFGTPIRNGGPGRLPEDIPLGIYITLAPFVGPEEASALANSRP